MAGTDFWKRRATGIALAAAVAVGVVVVLRTHDPTGRQSPAPSVSPPPFEVPGIYAEQDFQVNNDGDRGSYSMTITNAGTMTVTLYMPEASAYPPGMHPEGGGAQVPSVQLQAGASTPLTLTFRITDCSRVPAAPWPLAMRASVPGRSGPAVVKITPPGPGPVPWQKAAVADYCTP